jgi:hypothetical protein
VEEGARCIGLQLHDPGRRDVEAGERRWDGGPCERRRDWGNCSSVGVGNISAVGLGNNNDDGIGEQRLGCRSWKWRQDWGMIAGLRNIDEAVGVGSGGRHRMRVWRSARRQFGGCGSPDGYSLPVRVAGMGIVRPVMGGDAGDECCNPNGWRVWFCTPHRVFHPLPSLLT